MVLCESRGLCATIFFDNVANVEVCLTTRSLAEREKKRNYGDGREVGVRVRTGKVERFKEGGGGGGG